MTTASTANPVPRVATEVISSPSGTTGDRPVRLPEHASAPPTSVYRAVARACLPRLVHLLAAPVSRAFGLLPPSSDDAAPPRVHRRMLVTLGVAVAGELDVAGDDEPDGGDYPRACVRASLIQWQRSLRADGHPAGRHHRADPRHAMIAATVVRILNNTGCFQTETLLTDLARHLRWLVRRPRYAPPAEAARIEALAQGAMLVRDAALVDAARKRLGPLLARQHAEGWFMDRQGFSVDRLTAVVDALAAIFVTHQWEELVDPLRRALRFMAVFVRPGDRFGGDGVRSGGLLCPYGVEVLAPVLAEAVPLARLARRRTERWLRGNSLDACDEFCATAGPHAALAAIHASAKLPESCHYPYLDVGVTEFPGAGVAVFNTQAYHAIVATRRGAALHVAWRDRQPPLDDAGVAVVHARRTHCVRSWARHARSRVTDSSVTVSATLHPLDSPRDGGRLRALRQRLRNSWERCTASLSVRRRRPRAGAWAARFAADRLRREIAFGPDWIRIRDVVLCRRACRAVIRQVPASLWSRVSGDEAHPLNCPPIVTPGGRKIDIVRTYRRGELISDDGRRDA